MTINLKYIEIADVLKTQIILGLKNACKDKKSLENLIRINCLYQK
jgi:hypothetical protein